ncbi:MAG: hypothetical protein Q8W44_12570 [Candidatus Palauibacterales bacterium]|nr:hypothetical protein [Candidatus Palauibacterales bacterium]
MPPLPVVRSLVSRSALFWAAIRAALLPFGVDFGRPASAVLVVTLVTILTVVAMRRRGEHLFLGNLGVSLPVAAAVMGATAAALEVGAASVGRLL